MELKEKVIEHLETLDFYGIDDSLEESLFGYGLICQEWLSSEGFMVYHFIYRIVEDDNDVTKDLYNTDSFTTRKIDAFLDESWFDTDSFLSYVGLSKIGFLATSTVNKIFSYLQYHGYQNIFGTADYQITLKELLQQTK